ncbi:MAG: hypothetical protein R3E96_07590 [Planctomycetota bacterium]
MSRIQKWTLQLANLAVGVSGLVLAYMLFLLEPVDEFAIVNHPLQPDVRHLHILLAPALVFAIGWIWQNHVLRNWRLGRPQARRTGITLAALALPMVLSGYVVQVAEDPVWRNRWSLLHLIASAMAALGARSSPARP